jgi:tetratricopeptide (TPR) repeat protein
MGTVYRAHDPMLKRDVAVKLLSELGLGTVGRERLLHEAQAVAKLSHPNIVAVFDAGETEETPFIVMEVIDGESLHVRPPETLSDIVEVSKQVCAALEHAHESGVVHRDLKPENVIIDRTGNAKLMDFGIARSMATRLTSGGEVIGTVFYLAPEIALGHEYDGRADLYSLGVMLYELTTGALPFADGDPVAVISQHLHASVVPPRAKNPEVPPLLDTLIVQLMSKDPDGRPSTAAETHRMLKRKDLLDPEAKGEREVLVLDRIVRGRFVGREQELGEARSLWSKAETGEGQTLLVSGEPGVGKTRLMRELSTHVEVTGGRALIGFCYEEGGAPYAPFAQILRKALRAGSENGFHLPDFVLADLLDLAPELKPYYPDVPPNPGLEPDAEQQRLFENVVAFCGEVSQAAPLLLVLDDVHWADSGSLSLMRHLARRIRKKPILLLATYREIELDAARPFREVMLALNRERLARRLKLNRLSAEHTAALLEVIFQEDVSPEFLDGIYHETEGNPFFIEEVCKALIEEGQVFHTAEGWDRLDMEEMEIPQSVRDVVQARASKLSETYQDALTMAAVLGREFDFDTLVEASDQEENALIEALEAAEDAQLIQEVSGKGGATFSFVHALIPSTLVESVRTLRRRKLHKRAAAAIESSHPDDYESLAQHYEEAGHDEKALDYYTKAGERALSAFAIREAEQHFLAALELTDADSDAALLREQLGVTLAHQGRYTEAIETWKEAIRLHASTGSSERIAWCYARMGRTFGNAGEPAEALGLCENGLQELKDVPPSPELADLIHETGRAHHFAGETDRARLLCDQAVVMAREASAHKVEVDALITIGVLANTTIDDSIEILESAIQSAKIHELGTLETRARHNLGFIMAGRAGDDEAALAHYIAAANLSRQLQMMDQELFELSHIIENYIDSGRLLEAEDVFRRASELREKLKGPGAAVQSFEGMTGYLEWALGDLESATTRFRTLLEAAVESEGHYWIVNSSASLGIVLIEAGDFEGADEVLQGAVESADEAKFGQVWIRSLHAAAVAKLGEPSKARRQYEEARDIFHQNPQESEREILSVAKCHVLLAEDRLEDAFLAFESASKELERAGLRLRHTQLLHEWAEAHLVRGDPGDVDRAKELLGEVGSEYERMGAPAQVQRVQARLRELDEQAG